MHSPPLVLWFTVTDRNPFSVPPRHCIIDGQGDRSPPQGDRMSGPGASSLPPPKLRRQDPAGGTLRHSWCGNKGRRKGDICWERGLSLGTLSSPCLLSGQWRRAVISLRGGMVPRAWLNALPFPGSHLLLSQLLPKRRAGGMASRLSPAAGPGYHRALWGCRCDPREEELQTGSEDD